MGEVYLAIDTRLNRKVALKYLSDPSLDVPRARERLLREARAAAQITHPNIAAIYDILDTANAAVHRHGVRGRRDAARASLAGARCRASRCCRLARNSPTRWRTRTRPASSTAT